MFESNGKPERRNVFIVLVVCFLLVWKAGVSTPFAKSTLVLNVSTCLWLCAEFVIAAPRRSSVSFDATTGELKVPATAVYCVRVDVSTKDAAAAWTNYAACLNASTGTIVVSRDDVTDLRVAFCLSRRFDVCSSTVTATQGNRLVFFCVTH